MCACACTSCQCRAWPVSLGVGSVGHSTDPSCHAELVEGDRLTNVSKDGAIVFRDDGESLHESLRREGESTCLSLYPPLFLPLPLSLVWTLVVWGLPTAPWRTGVPPASAGS